MCSSDLLTSFAEALGWGSLSAPQFCDQLDRLAARIGLLDQLRSVPVRLGSVQEMARDAVANRRLMDPNPLNLGESDVVTIYKNVLQL